MRYPCCSCCCGVGREGVLINSGCRGLSDHAHHTEPCPNQPSEEED